MINYVKVTISDTGTGIAGDIQHRIFDPFFSTKDKSKGTGLGLSVVYGVVKNHGGFINLKSEPMKGTTFDIYIPASTKVAASSNSDASVKESRGGHENIPIDPAVKIIVSSGYSSDGHYQTVLKKGAKGFIQKPYKIDNLTRMVRQVMDES
jgi:DNA-binding NarL/FixJ family response regulator